MMTRVLLTGATGVLGSELLGSLRRRGAEVVAVSRRGTPDEGVLRWRMGAEPPPDELPRRFDAVVHAAATTRWNQDPEEAWAGNVQSTEAVLELVGDDTHLVHVSTAFAVGLRGDTSSARLSDYRNSYEWSKAAAERLVTEHSRCTVVRPPLIIGRRTDGHIARFSGLYTFARACVTGLAPAMVGEPKGTVEMVPVDDVADAVLAALDAGPAADRAGPVVLGTGTAALTTEDLVQASFTAINGWRARHGASRLAPPPIISAERWDRFFLPFARTTLTGRQLRVIELLSEFVPYVSMAEAPEPTVLLPAVHDALALSLSFWADANSRVASAEPRPWAA
ncbi:SDR family oxidoreductase [Actinomadura sp. 3N508]|uniref:SDR family oxidoreductase n=1 Tax=Actinomadura sp. 3N508 TaxID=3375153 RepID=UPI0037AF408D